MKIAVVGAGVAGVAAAFAARRLGAQVTVVCRGAGAASLYSGALDDCPAAGKADDDVELMRFCTAFDVWSVGRQPALIATNAGVLRSARGRDGALLDLAPLAGKRIAVADVSLSDWDGPFLARSLASSPWAVRTKTRFEAVSVAIMGGKENAHVPPYDIAVSFDDVERARSLGRRLVEASATADAWLLGPWLGTSPEIANEVQGALGRPCGEVTSAPGGAAGARFEGGRARLLAELGVRMIQGRASAIEATGARWVVQCDSDDAVEADAVVVAVGGIVGGGITLVDPAEAGRGHFELGVRAPLALALDGHIVDAASTLHGVDVQATGLEALERVGVMARGVRAVGPPGLYVAGDTVEGSSHTALAAARSGLRAGATAARS